MALTHESPVQSYTHQLEGELTEKRNEVSALRGQLAYSPPPARDHGSGLPQAIGADLF